MRRSSVVVLSMVLAAATAIQAQEKSEVESSIVSMEKTLWEGWKQNDVKPFETHLGDDYVGVMSSGITSGKVEAIKQLTSQPCVVKGYSFSDMKVSLLGKDTAILTYKASQDATCGGQKIPAEIYASSVFVKKGDKWLVGSHQETPAETAGP